MTKICRNCNSFFETSTTKAYCSAKCKSICRNRQLVINVTKRRKKLKLMAIEYKGGCCIGCGYKRSVAALDFHHLDPAKKDFGLGMNGLTRSWQKTKEELDKCILVCSNCHREVHAGLIILNSKGKVVKKIRASKTKEMLE